MTLKECQDWFVEELGLFDEWPDKFNLIIEYANQQEKDLPEDLLRYRISNCQSRTYFKAENNDGHLIINGWSNSSIMAGLVVCFKAMFNHFPLYGFRESAIDFHIRSGLFDHITPMRKAAVLEMIERLNVLSTKNL